MGNTTKFSDAGGGLKWSGCSAKSEAVDSCGRLEKSLGECEQERERERGSKKTDLLLLHTRPGNQMCCCAVSTSTAAAYRFCLVVVTVPMLIVPSTALVGPRRKSTEEKAAAT